MAFQNLNTKRRAGTPTPPRSPSASPPSRHVPMTRWPRMMRAIVTSATLIAAAYTLDHLFNLLRQGPTI